MSDDLTASGGWCAPYEIVYDTTAPFPHITLPDLSTARGGITFEDRRTPAEKAQAEYVEQYLAIHVGDIMRAQHYAIDAACWHALHNRYDVHVQRHYGSRFVGIEFAPREEHRLFPTVHEHTLDSWRWEDEW